jgi:branched-chain amino acid transport system permease protein
MPSLDVFLQQLINGLSLGGIYALIALGYTMVYGIIELINFAHGDVYTLGTFFSLATLSLLGVSGELHGLPLLGVALLTILVSMLLCGLTGVIIERLAYRRLRNAPRLAPLITAIGMSFILENIMQYWKGPAPIPVPQFIPNPSFHVGSIEIAAKQVLVIVLAVVMMVALQLFIYNTRMGKAMRATAQDPDAARLMGINVDRTISLTFLLGGLLAGAAGMIYALYNGTIQFNQGFTAGLIAFTAAVMGGIGNLKGAVVGGLIIGVIQSVSDTHFGQVWTPAVVFAILILIMVFKPQGLFGEETREG